MKLSKCDVETNNIANLPDKPALTPTDLKRKFDAAENGIKKFINESLIPEIEAEFEKKVTAVVNNFLMTKEEREKLTGIEEGANKVIIKSGYEDPNKLGVDADYYVQIFKEEE